MQRATKRMRHRGLAEAAHARRGQTAALALSALCASSVLSNAHGDETARPFLGPRWVNRGSPIFGGQPWVPAQKSSTVGPRDQLSLLRALGNQTKLSTFDTVAFRVRRRLKLRSSPMRPQRLEENWIELDPQAFPIQKSPMFGKHRARRSSAECSQYGSLPCSFGGCEFSKTASGVLDRTGSCPTQGGILNLNNKSLTGLRDGVFSNMGACE
jgi:hypothetical protein